MSAYERSDQMRARAAAATDPEIAGLLKDSDDDRL